MNRNDDKEILELLEIVDLTSKKDVPFKNFSLGMKQRLGIAAALLGVALIFVVWALATKKENAKSYLTAWLVCVIFTLLFITNK